MGSVINRPAVLQLFHAQHSVATVRQLRDLSVSHTAIDRARARGTVVTVVPGILRLAGAPETFASQAMALQLFVGGRAFVSGTSAGVFHGLRQMPRRPVEITVRETRKVKMPEWGRLVRTSWIDEARDVQAREDGLRIAAPLRTLFRLARVFNQYRFERAAEDCWHRRLVTPEQAIAYLDVVRRSGRAGVSQFERWLEQVACRQRPSQSSLELDVLEAILRAGLPEPERQVPLTLRSGELIHLDLAWPKVRLGVEPGHSWWHGGDLRQRADQARDRACDEVGWRIIRCNESVREELGSFGLQLRIIYDERLSSLRSA